MTSATGPAARSGTERSAAPSPPDRAAQALGALVVVLLLVGVAVAVARTSGAGSEEAAAAPDQRQIVVGAVDPAATVPAVDPDAPLADGPGVAVLQGGRLGAVGEPAPAPEIQPPDGAPPGPPIPFLSPRQGVAETTFVLVAGADARPGEDVLATRADSIHVVAVNPERRAGTIVGIPRDAWVDVPGHGRQKINSALALGGPQLLARTVSEVTGIPLRFFVVTGFDGFRRLVDDLGGVDVHLDRRMNDASSGARFERGWHRLLGEELLAFARNRKDVAYGDFSRSLNHGVAMLATLYKMRAEVADEGGLGRWLEALRRHVRVEVGFDELVELGVTARRLDPRRVANIVASGTVGTAGGQSVVFLDDDARALFADVADDGVLRDPPPPYDPPGTRDDEVAPTTTTTSPARSVPLPSTSTTTSTTTTSTSTSTTTTTAVLEVP